jgi:hypothetical protein
MKDIRMLDDAKPNFSPRREHTPKARCSKNS